MAQQRITGTPASNSPPTSIGPIQPCPLTSQCTALLSSINEVDAAIPRAELAEDVYKRHNPGRGPNAPLPDSPAGFTRISGDPAKMRDILPGLSDEEIKNLTHPDNSTYRAAVYQDVSGKLFIVFRGTTGLKDWKENVLQGLGLESEHYESAKRLCVALRRGVGAENMEIIGHSKGGGMAAAGGLLTGSKTTTFNSAGLHSHTVKEAELSNAPTYVTDFVVDGEVLNWLQDNRTGILGGVVLGAMSVASRFGWRAAALAGVVATDLVEDTLPQAAGRRIGLPAIWDEGDPPACYDPLLFRVELHGMNKVKQGLNEHRWRLCQDYNAAGCCQQAKPRCCQSP